MLSDKRDFIFIVTLLKLGQSLVIGMKVNVSMSFLRKEKLKSFAVHSSIHCMCISASVIFLSEPLKGTLWNFSQVFPN